MQLSPWPISTTLTVSYPLSAAQMPADGTVENSFVKQSANGGKVAVDNYGATCSAPVMACNPAVCLVHVGTIVVHVSAMIVLPLLSFQACCRPC